MRSDEWLAGLYEGEGCLSRLRDGHWQICISMTDEDVIREAARVGGCGAVTPKPLRNPRHTDQWRWRVGRQSEVFAVLQRLRPFLGQRRGARVDEFFRWYAQYTPYR